MGLIQNDTKNLQEIYIGEWKKWHKKILVKFTNN